jgi:uroporphyrin-III C-methyltransferase/precorrin-2 dehydrogenase/sirohydrochlorin ferrochelatase
VTDGPAAPRYYPVALDLRGRRCVVIGGGSLAEQKVLGLCDAGARVTVVSPSLTPALEELARRRVIDVRQRHYRRGDLRDAWLAIAAADDRAVNAAIWEEAERLGTPLNAVDDVPHCSFIAPAVHRAGDITVTVSTAGKSPAMAVRLRERIARTIDAADAGLVDLLGTLRPEVARRVPDAAARARLWYEIVNSDVVDYVRTGDLDGARARIESLIRGQLDGAGAAARAAEGGDPPARAAAPAPREGVVYLVGAGPGDPGLMTVRGLALLRAADAVVYDRLVPPSLVELARESAERFFVGKHPAEGGVPQSRIADLLIALARRHAVVVRLKGGDPFVFGRGAEELEALDRAGIRGAVVPGVTSAVAVPAAAGIPVTHRRHASAFAVITGHECAGSSDLDWSALARMPTLVVLMGLRSLSHVTARLLAHGAAPDTPAAVIAEGTLPTMRTVVATIATIAAEVDVAGIESPATLIVGNVVRVRAGSAGPGAPALEVTRA